MSAPTMNAIPIASSQKPPTNAAPPPSAIVASPATNIVSPMARTTIRAAPRLPVIRRWRRGVAVADASGATITAVP